MIQFATAGDVATLLRRDLDMDELTAADLLIESASGVIRAHVRQTISAVANDVAQLRGNWTHRLVLPERPVTGVAAVVAGPTTLVANVDYVWPGREDLLRGPALTNGMTADLGRPGHWGGPDLAVQVTYSHGYSTIPFDVRSVTLDLIERRLTRPLGVVREDLGRYKVQYTPGEPSGMVLLPSDERALKRYRRLP